MPGRVSDAALLAGGRGSRLPASSAGLIGGKLQAELMGTSLLSISLAGLAGIFPDPFVVAPAGLEIWPGISPGQGFRMLADEPVGSGPGAGIAAAVRNSSDWCFIAAADMPFLDARLIEDFAGSVERLPDSSLCAVPEWSKGLEPLHAFYRRGAYGLILEFLGSGNRSLTGLAEKLSAVRLDAEAAAFRTGSELELAFFNLNTAEDLEKAREIMRRREVKP